MFCAGIPVEDSTTTSSRAETKQGRRKKEPLRLRAAKQPKLYQVRGACYWYILVPGTWYRSAYQYVCTSTLGRTVVDCTVSTVPVLVLVVAVSLRPQGGSDWRGVLGNGMESNRRRPESSIK